ncbi:MAG: hypothetical protein K6E61_01165 [Bacteroidales bacterium]|nr:hypothetical protein [Bacteroidales bacterium]
MKRIITILAACLMGLSQAYAQNEVFISEDDYSAKDYFQQHPDRKWYPELKLNIRTSDYFDFGYFPEYMVRLDYFLCEALTHKVLSIESRTVSIKANDFADHSVLLKAPAGQVIRDDIHYDFQTKVNGIFESRFGGFNGRLSFVPMFWRNRELYVSQSEVERFYFDNIPGETYKQLNDPKLPTNAVFYVDEEGNAFIYNEDKNDLPKNMGNYAHPDGVDRPSMRDGFWPRKINGYHVKHNMVFKLKYNNGEKPLPSNLKLYLFMESPLYDRNGNLRRIADCTHGGIELELSSKSSRPWIQSTFNMDDDERLFVYPVWEVVAKDLNTGKCHVVDWGLLDMHIMSSDNTYAFNVLGTIKNGDLLQSIKNGDLKVDRGK